MIDPRNITPLLNNMVIEQELGKGPNGTVYLAQKTTDHKRYAVKHISIPASESKTKALIYSGAVRTEREAQRYYNGLVKDIKNELVLINNVKNAPNIHKYRGYQVDQKVLGSGYDLYLLAAYDQSLPRFLQKPITKVNAVNLGIDLAAALEQLRSEGLIHKDVKPTNVFYSENAAFSIGDLGIAQLSELGYSTMPDAMMTAYTAPEVLPADANLSATMDIYSVGVILYQVYNGGTFPVDASGHFVNSKDVQPQAPAYADERMAEIILKACAFRPEDRYQNPSELKNDLVLYAQSGDVSGDYLVPQPDMPAAPEEPAENAEAESTSDTDAAAAVDDNTMIYGAPLTDDTIAVPDFGTQIMQAVGPAGSEADGGDTIQIPKITEKEPEFLSGPETKKRASGTGALNSLGKDDPILAPSGEQSVEDFLAKFRKKSGAQLYTMDNTGNMTEIPGFAQHTASGTDVVESADTDNAPDPVSAPAEAAPSVPHQGEIPAGIHLPAEVFADDAPKQAPAAAVPEPNALSIDDVVNAVAAQINNTQSDPVTVSDPVLIQSLTQQNAQPAMRAPAPAPVRRAPAYPVEGDDDDDDEYDDDEDDEEEEEKHGSALKTILITLLILIILAGGAYALYIFKTDTISDISTSVLSSSSIEVTTLTTNNSAMEVVCSTDAGEISRVPVADHTATFTGLSPNTSYTFTLASTEGKFLLGTKTATATTSQMTNLNGFALTSYSATTASFSLSGTGAQPDSWLVTLTPETGDAITQEVTGTEFTIEGLTPQTTYQVSIARGDGDALGGTTTCTVTTQEYTVLSSFATTALTTNSMSLAWDYTGTEPNSWSLTCTGSDGSSLTQDISGTECTLNDLTAGVTYTLTLSCDSLQASDLSTIEVSIPSITVTGTSSYVDDENHLVFTWEYDGNTAPTVWTVSYTYDSSVAPETATSDTNSITLPNLLPNTSYEISVIGADDLTVGGENATGYCTTPAAQQYTAYGCTDPSLTLYVKSDDDPDLENATTEFTTDDYIAFAIEVSYEETEEEKTAATMYIIRDYNGTPVHVYESSRTWNGNWTTARHTGDLPDTIDEPGSYTMEVYFDGCFMASADFNVS